MFASGNIFVYLRSTFVVRWDKLKIMTQVWFFQKKIVLFFFCGKASGRGLGHVVSFIYFSCALF